MILGLFYLGYKDRKEQAECNKAYAEFVKLDIEMRKRQIEVSRKGRWDDSCSVQ